VLLPEFGDVGVEDGDPVGFVDDPLGEAGELVPGSHGGATCSGVVLVLLLVLLLVRDPLCVLPLFGLLRALVPSCVVDEPLRLRSFRF